MSDVSFFRRSWPSAWQSLERLPDSVRDTSEVFDASEVALHETLKQVKLVASQLRASPRGKNEASGFA